MKVKLELAQDDFDTLKALVESEYGTADDPKFRKSCERILKAMKATKHVKP